MLLEVNVNELKSLKIKTLIFNGYINKMLDIIIAPEGIIIFIKKSRGNFTFFQSLRIFTIQFF